MEIAQILDTCGGSAGRSDTKYDQRRATYVLELLIRSPQVEEFFLGLTSGVNPQRIHTVFTEGLLDLQDTFDKRQPGLGQEVAKHINSLVESAGVSYFTLLGLIKFLLDHKGEQSPELVRELPDIIATVRGRNGIDTKLLRYHFVTVTLPGAKLETPEEARVLATKYVERNARNASQPDERTREYQRICEEMYDGDFEQMKEEVIGLLQEPLEQVIRKMKAIEQAEAHIPSSGNCADKQHSTP